MKKTGLKEMKRRNREMLIRTILEKGELSRIELAHETQLSPSTVSALVGELLEEGILAESGQRAITAGPKPYCTGHQHRIRLHSGCKHREKGRKP